MSKRASMDPSDWSESKRAKRRRGPHVKVSVLRNTRNLHASANAPYDAHRIQAILDKHGPQSSAFKSLLCDFFGQSGALGRPYRHSDQDLVQEAIDYALSRGLFRKEESGGVTYYFMPHDHEQVKTQIETAKQSHLIPNPEVYRTLH